MGRGFALVVSSLAFVCVDSLTTGAFGHPPTRVWRSAAVECKEKFEAPDGYFEGMLTSPLDARSDEKLDNITRASPPYTELLHHREPHI